MNLPRTTRARPVQLMRDRIIVMSRYICTGGMPAGMAADSAIHRGREGREFSTSITR